VVLLQRPFRVNFDCSGLGGEAIDETLLTSLDFPINVTSTAIRIGFGPNKLTATLPPAGGVVPKLVGLKTSDLSADQLKESEAFLQEIRLTARSILRSKAPTRSPSPVLSPEEKENRPRRLLKINQVVYDPESDVYYN
jgi:hypothetical protein